jgi:hypothetical protein
VALQQRGVLAPIPGPTPCRSPLEPSQDLSSIPALPLALIHLMSGRLEFSEVRGLVLLRGGLGALF